MKKNILKLLFLAISSFCCTAQSQVTFTGLKKDYTQSMDSLLTYVDKAPITTGILYDRVMSFTNLSLQREEGAITKSNYENFIQSWSELYRAAYNPSFLSLENLKANINSNANPNLIDIGIINTNINYLDFGTKLKPSLRTANGYLYNVTGRNPVVEKPVTVISPLKAKVTSGTITFRLKQSLILQLTGAGISNLTVNFGTGVIYNLITNGVVSNTNPTITFTTGGLQEFEFVATYTDNTSETLKATMIVDLPVINTTNTARSAFDTEENFVGIAGIDAASAGNLGFKGYNETTATKGVLEYRTYYSLVNNNGSAASKIKKEIIILDGFDPGDGRKIYRDSNGYDPYKKSIYELMYYNDENGNIKNLVDKLRTAPYGFDVTLVNFPNGADYVERNAMALVALLNRENAKLAYNGSSEKISIIGPSMGGLVSRYALAYMEKNGMNHNTKLWVSFDSPHLGANIPLAAQENLYFYGYKGRNDKAKLKFDENFRSPAARQMLIEQLDYAHENAPYNIDLMQSGFIPSGANNNSPFRTVFQNNLIINGLSGSRGYPQNLRKVALINGTTSGTKTNIEGQMFLELAAFKKIRYGLAVGIGGAIITHNPLFLLGTPLYTNIKVATIEDRFLGYQNTLTQTFAGKATYFTGWNNNFPATINGKVLRFNSNLTGSMDIVPGGLFNTQEIILKEFHEGLIKVGISDIQWRTYVPNHTFIPTVSALAFKNSNFDWSTNINRNLVCDPLNKEIEFDSYFAPKGNEDHVFVTAESVNWLLKELDNNPQAPYYPLEENLIRGNPSLCNDKIETYFIHEICKVPSPVKYNNQAGLPVNGWSVEGNIVILSSTPYTITVKGTSNVMSDGKIIATFQNGLKSSKIVKIGSPGVNGQTIRGGYDKVGINATDSFSLSTPVNGATSYLWTITTISTSASCGCTTDANGFITCPSSVVKPKFMETGTSSYDAQLSSAMVSWGNCPGTYLVTCYAISSCGSTYVSMKNVVVFSSTTGGSGDNPCPNYSLRVYPNPVTTGNIEVNIIPPPNPCNNLRTTASNTANANKDNEVKIYDFMGVLVYSKKHFVDTFTISNLNLTQGNYILHVDTKRGNPLREIIIVD